MDKKASQIIGKDFSLKFHVLPTVLCVSHRAEVVTHFDQPSNSLKNPSDIHYNRSKTSLFKRIITTGNGDLVWLVDSIESTEGWFSNGEWLFVLD